jgi:HEAT repeat protein
MPHPLSEVERLGEELRDAVRPLPTLEEFLGAVRDPDPRGREAAVAAFGYEGNFAAIPYISAVLLRFDEPVSVRTAAARALGRIGDRRARSFLSRALRGAGDESLREALRAALDAARRRF